MIRNLHSLDLLLSPLKQWEGLTEHSVTLDRLERQDASGPMAALTKEGIVPTRRSHFWAAEDGGRVDAVIEGRARSGRPNTWEIPHLWTGDAAVRAVAALLEEVPAEAAKHGATRVFLRLAADSPHIAAALQAGFATAFEESLLVRDSKPPFAHSAAQADVRKRHAEDDLALFRLFNAHSPINVRCAVGLTLEEWRDSHEHPGGKTEEWVYARQGEDPSGLVQVWPGKNAIHAQLVAGSPQGLGELLGKVVPDDHAGRVCVLVPDFLPASQAALQESGFVPAQRFVVLVKLVAVLVREVSFAPASA